MTVPSKPLKELFLSALEVPADDRAEWLDRECAGDVRLREQLQLMLAAHDAPHSLLDQPSMVEPTDIRPITEHSGDTIGPYKLLQQIGEGGMGVVYMAEQSVPVERRVALKIIKPGMDTQQIIARFEAERQALAMMDHPNIAKVLDAGTTETGRPYFVMELVKGMSVTQYCDEQHLTPRERLELFLPICQAVQHAHQKGIIHRDLKPSNILVAQYDNKPIPKVIDFGVAKAISQKLTEKTMFTQYGQIVGTIEYMSPEQARFNQLDVDTRSDIYSLGVLLYELLTGETPFDKKRLRSAAFDELLRIIREEEPPKPSTKLSSSELLANTAANRKTEPKKLSLLVRGELDWIVMKSLEKDRARRYETANGFAMDIQRYLADEPVQACPPSAGYRFRKFARRNRAALYTTATVAAALVAGIIGTTWQAIRATEEAKRATKAEAFAEDHLAAEKRAREQADDAWAAESVQRQLALDEKQRAKENFDKARRAVDEYLSQVTESDLLSVPGLQPLREELLQAALKFYVEFTEVRANDPMLRQELASAHHRLAKIEYELGNTAAAETANLEAIRLYEELRDQGQMSLDLQAGLASAYYFAHRYDDTIDLCQTILQIEPQHAEIRSLLGYTYNQLAVNDEYHGPVALKYHQLAFELRDALVRDYPENPRYLAQLGGTVHNLGVLLSSQEKPDEALAMYKRATQYLERAYESAPHSITWGRWLCQALTNSAQLQVKLDKPDEALQSYERLVEVCRKRVFENPALGSLRGDLYQAHLMLGKHQKRLGNESEGARCFRLAREVLEQVPRETPDQLLELAIVYAVLASPAESNAPDEADAAERQHNADLAMETLRKAVESGYHNASVLERNSDLGVLRSRDDFRALLTTVQQLAEIDRLVRAKDANSATKLTSYQQAADLLKGLPSSQQHRETLAATMHSIGVIRTGLKQFDEAEKSFDEALELREQLLKEQNANPQARVNVLTTRAAMGQLDWARDRQQDAHRRFQEILTECRTLAVEHAEDALVQRGILGIERSIADEYGEIGLLEAGLQYVDRAVETGQLFDSAGYSHGAHVLAALGRLEQHKKLCQLIADQWGKYIPAHTVWATSMNPQPVLESTQLLELAERVIKSNLDPLWRFKAATAWYWTGDYNRALEIMLAAREEVAAEEGSACLHWYAMVYDKLGQKEVSASYFEEAEAKYLKSADKSARAGAWKTWVEDQAARRLAWHELRGTADLQDPWQHLVQARGYRLIGEMEKADRELAAAVATSPDDANVWVALAHDYIRLSQWEQAAAAYAKADLGARPLNDDAFAYACLFLIQEDRQGYDQFCNELIRRVGQTASSSDGYVLARSCSIVSNSSVDPVRSVEWASQAVASSQQPWDFHVLGLAQYRAGQFDEALQSFTRSNDEAWGSQDLNWFGLALVHHSLHQPDDARECLYKGLQWLERVGPANLPPQDRLEALVLLREAEDQIGEIEKAYTDWQSLALHKNLKEILRETAERCPDDLMLLAKLKGHSERICTVAFLPDRQRMVSVGRDKFVRTWDLDTGSVLSTLSVTAQWLGAEADVSADGRFVAVIISKDGRKGFCIWDLENRKQICEMFPPNVAYLDRIRFSPDGTRVLTTGKPYVGVLWDASTGAEVQRFDVDDSYIHSIELSPDGRLLAIGMVGRVWLFDVETGQVLGDARLTYNRSVASLAFTPSGDLLACGQTGGHLSVIDVSNRQLTASFANPESGPNSNVMSMHFLDGNRSLLITRLNGALEVWDLATTKIVAAAASRQGTGRRLAVSPDGHYALTAHGEVWDSESNSPKPNGDYALRLWQLPRRVWPDLERPSNGVADSDHEEN